MPRFTSWQSCEWSLISPGGAAVIQTHIRAVSYSDALESELVKGAGRDVIGTTDPSYTPGEMSIEMYEKWFREFAREVTNDGEIPLGELDFRLVVKRQARGETDARVDAVDFQITGVDDEATAGEAAPLVTTVACLITRIERNGVRL
jgi:hypothetical protein